MRNFSLALAFMLIGSFAFASEEMRSTDVDIKKTTIVEGFNIFLPEIIDDEVVDCPIYHYVYRSDGSLMGQFVVYAPDEHEDCYGTVFHLR